MKKLAGKTWIKVLCAFLTVLFAATVGVSIVAVSVLADGGAYSGGTANNLEKDMMREQLNRDTANVVSYYYSSLAGDTSAMDEAAEQYGSENSNFCFEIVTENGTVLYKNYDGAGTRVSMQQEVKTNGTTVTVNTWVRQELSAMDAYRNIAQYFSWMFAAKNWIIVIFCACTALGLALFIFLVYAAGKREGTNEIAARWIDKIPCDLFTFILISLLLGIASAVSDVDLSPYCAATYISCGGAAAAGTFLGALLCMSWAVRFRLGGWWKNSIVYYLLRWLKKPFGKLRELAKSLPLIWQTALVLLCAFLLELIVYATRASLLWFLLNAFIPVAVLYFFLDMRKLRDGARALAAGDFDSRVDVSKMHWEFKSHGDDLNRIGDGIALAVEKQLKSERMKTELITNVSHDIKTPLTSIINYVDLLKKEEIQPDEAKEYIAVLDRQSQRLRKLTEDVIEASKASTGNIPVELSKTDMNVLLSQAAGEYGDKLAQNQLELVLGLSEKPLEIMADGRLLWRVFDNLMGNAAKYAMPGTRVYVTTSENGGRAEAVFKNISEAQLNISADELMERFTRGDTSRNTEGSGLGLSIADSLTGLQGGKFGIEIDGDLFKAKVSFPLTGDTD